MMPDMPWPGHFDTDIYRGSDHFLGKQRAQSIRVLDAVLQRQHHGIRRKMRLDGSRTAFGVGGLHAKSTSCARCTTLSSELAETRMCSSKVCVSSLSP
jgi:hypothetical protein